MAYGYQHSGIGTVIGTPSAGAVSSGALVVMPGDLGEPGANRQFQFPEYSDLGHRVKTADHRISADHWLMISTTRILVGSTSTT
jgi:hypothetical protein